MPRHLNAPDTVVVCRPGQMREAAVVLSCFPRANQPALFVMDPSPCSEAEYAALHESYRVMRNARDEATGRRKSRLSRSEPQTPPEWSNEEIDRRAEALTPFRRWTKRNRIFSELLKELPLRRAILLFEATDGDMSMFETVPIGRIRPEVRTPLLPSRLPWLNLTTEAANGEFTRKAWQMVRENEAFPELVVSCPPDAAELLVALDRALQNGSPLVIDGQAASPAETVDNPHATECVLIEADDTAARLVAVQYALRQNALLCVSAAPDTSAIENARQRIEDWQEGKLPDADPAALLAAMEGAVSQVVPDAIVERVGELPLTAFTAGVPYHFLHKGNADWSHKPIGLMSGDEFMIASIELYRDPGDDLPHFNILFDPGYFNPRETDGVMRALKSAHTFPLLLQKGAASITALIALAGAQVDLLYFNTHGSASGMALAEMPLPNYKLLQRITLGSHPIVFNDACLSWTGVGREFIAVGARAFLGTLWSVNADDAATYAIAVSERMMHGDVAVASCMRGTAADPITEKAYVFVGPVGMRLRDRVPQVGSEQATAYALAGALLQLATYVARSGPPPDSPYTGPIISSLLHNAQELCDEIDRRWPQPSVARVNLLTDQLAMGNALRFDQATAGFYAALSMRGLKMTQEVPWKTREENKVKADFRQACARIARKMEQLQPAANLLRLCAGDMEKEGLNPGGVFLDLSDLYLAMGMHDYALESALRAKEAFEKPEAKADKEVQAVRGLMLAWGRLAQLLRRANQTQEAEAAVREGYLAAEAVDDLREQAIFKMDESRIHQVRGDFPSAVKSAEGALQKALWSRDEDIKVAAYGTLTRALIFAGDLARASQNATEGRDLALEQDIPSQIADFQMDLCDIESQSGDTRAALVSLREAADCLVDAGNPEQIKRALTKSGVLFSQLKSWGALSDLAVLGTSVLPALETPDRSSVCTFLVQTLQKQIASLGWPASRDGLWKLRSDLQSAGKRRTQAIPEQAQFILDFAEACHAFVAGKREAALVTMQRLDTLSANGFQLVDFLAKGSAPV